MTMRFYLPDGTETEQPYASDDALLEYTPYPTHLRIYHAHDGRWDLDGVDAQGRYTEAAWTYCTEEEALEARDNFVLSNFRFRSSDLSGFALDLTTALIDEARNMPDWERDLLDPLPGDRMHALVETLSEESSEEPSKEVTLTLTVDEATALRRLVMNHMSGPALVYGPLAGALRKIRMELVPASGHDAGPRYATLPSPHYEAHQVLWLAEQSADFRPFLPPRECRRRRTLR